MRILLTIVAFFVVAYFLRLVSDLFVGIGLKGLGKTLDWLGSAAILFFMVPYLVPSFSIDFPWDAGAESPMVVIKGAMEIILYALLPVVAGACIGHLRARAVISNYRDVLKYRSVSSEPSP